MSRDRRGAERAGRLAELAAAMFLTLKGYRILTTRFRARGGEIDLVARRGDALIFVEVKRRIRLDDALSAVDYRSRRRIETAADAFRAARPDLAHLGGRYDVIASAGLKIAHVRGAWIAGD